MSGMKDKAKEAGKAVAETAKSAAHKVGEVAGKTVDMVKEKIGACGERKTAILEHMDVYASCGKKVGVVDHVEGQSIKLTKNDSPDGQHHKIPSAWVDHVDNHVHLSKNSMETEQDWQPA